MAYKDIEKQREFQRLWKRNQNARHRSKAIEILGGKCRICGITDTRVLQIEHIEPILRPRGSEKSRNTGIESARAVVLGKVTDKEVQLICANCHCIKTYEDRKKYKNWKGEKL